MKKIIFTIDPAGNSGVDNVIGFGDQCKNVTAPIEKRLGIANEASRSDTEQLHIPPMDETVTVQT